MMLTIFGIPQKITYNDLKKLIQEKCNISQFLLGDFLQDMNGKKNIKICVTDGNEGDLVIKGLDGYKLDKSILSVAPVASKTHTVEKSRVVTMNTAMLCTEKIDNQVTSSTKPILKVKELPTENKLRKKKSKAKRASKKRRLKIAKKQALMNDAFKIATPIFFTDMISQYSAQLALTMSQPASFDQRKETTPSIKMSFPVVKETCKRLKEMTKADELVMDRIGQKRSKLDVKAASKEKESGICVVITSGLTGHLSQDAVDLVLDSIHTKLIEDSNIETIYIPVFTKNPQYIDGTVILFCKDQNTFNWLEPVVLNPELMRGMLLTINKVDFKDKLLCGIVIPDRADILKNPRLILQLLSRQNHWIDVNSWQFVGSEPQPQNYFMKVLIPKNHWNVLISRKSTLAYSLGSVFVKFLGQAEIKVEDVSINSI
ncbi:hypothetical protein RR48_07131 [Papilio machaon]|uniref:DUF4780 domain-containing protein n=1 Tax=Papilio machaon TaxID=76193 RepID=A0A194RIJ3_PAPMA|nr:hypothetical protein RR48_07131 [Papilio machaon]